MHLTTHLYIPMRRGAFAALACVLSMTQARAQTTIPVGVAIAERQVIFQAIPMTGTVTSPRSARLSAAISGQVHRLDVDAGKKVTRGDILLELDPELAELDLKSAQARLLQDRRNLDDSRRRLREARELIPQASIAESTVRDLEAEVALDEAAVEQMAAEAARQQAILARHQLRAPFDGVVSAKLTELGEWVTPGTPVLALVATEGLRLDFSVAEDFLSSIPGGASVRYNVSANPQQRFDGIVDTVVPVTDPNARTFLLRVMPAAEQPVLRPGMSVSATLALDTGREGIVIPRDALLRYPDGRQVVWTVTGDAQQTRVGEQRVQVGSQFNSLIEIRSGIAAGDRVVVEGNEALRNGQAVSVRSSVASSAGRGKSGV